MYTSLIWILAEGRRSELVRERAGMIAENESSENCLREQVRSYALRAEALKPFILRVLGLVYNDECST